MPYAVIRKVAADPSRIRLLGPPTVMADTDRLTYAVHETKRSFAIGGHASPRREARAKTRSSANEMVAGTTARTLRRRLIEMSKTMRTKNRPVQTTGPT